MKHGGRSSAVLVGVVASLGLTLGLVFDMPVSRADDPATLDQAKTQLAALQAQTSTIEVQVEQSQDIMNQALVEQAALQDDIAAQQAVVDGMAPAFAEIVNAQRQGRPWEDAVRFLLNDDSAEFIDHIGVTATVQSALNEQMARLGDEKLRLAGMNDELDVTIKSVQAELSVQQALLAQQASAEAQAQTLVSKLTVEQRAALGTTRIGKGVKPQTANLISVVRSLFPQIATIGTLRSGNGDHGNGLAADIMIPDYKKNVDLGWQIANYVQAHASELHVKYIIWQQSIWQANSPGKGWKRMADRGSDNENHINHVHVSLLR